MLLAGILLKLGGYGIFRFFSHLCFFIFYYGGYLFVIGLISIVFSSLVCVRQRDFKMLVAYSSVCHMGYVVCGGYSLCFVGLIGGMVILFCHGICSSCLFFLFNLLYLRSFSRRRVVCKGGSYSFRYFSYVFLVFFAFNMGMPPFISFFSEVFVMFSFVYYFFVLSILLGFGIFMRGVYNVYGYGLLGHRGRMSRFFYCLTFSEWLICYVHFFVFL
jgi:NADH:ubiquinone oxidoreductase subunit 4 (subunit M)